jgi:hypothetical protein
MTGGWPCIWNIFGNFFKNLNGSNGIIRVHRPGGRKFMNTTEVKNRVTLSLYNVSNLTVTLCFILSRKGVKSWGEGNSQFSMKDFRSLTCNTCRASSWMENGITGNWPTLSTKSARTKRGGKQKGSLWNKNTFCVVNIYQQLK